MTTPVLEISHVSKVFEARFGRDEVKAVQDVSFQLAKGEILGLLGPNGAGKTTTIKMIAGLLTPTSGDIFISGHPVASDRSRAVRRLGAVLEGNRNLHWKLTASENLSYFGALKGVPDLPRRIDAILERLDLGAHRKKRVGELSRGLQQRVAIAIALINQPDVLLLDEPTLGLDVIAATSFKDIVRAIASDGCGIILTTHQMEVAQELSERVAVISQGRLAVSQSLNQLLSAYRTPGYVVRARGNLPEAPLLALGAEDIRQDGLHAEFRIPESRATGIYEVFGILQEAGAELVDVQQQEINLEGIYRRIIGEVAP